MSAADDAKNRASEAESSTHPKTADAPPGQPEKILPIASFLSANNQPEAEDAVREQGKTIKRDPRAISRENRRKVSIKACEINWGPADRVECGPNFENSGMVMEFDQIFLNKWGSVKNYVRNMIFHTPVECIGWLKAEEYHWGGWIFYAYQQSHKFMEFLGRCHLHWSKYECTQEIAVLIIIHTLHIIVYEKNRHNHKCPFGK
ncbi:unnamed protein product [Gongylonema pulchrum]|uniref:DUF3444 domain-containing protein n=1 Tax=Gongylonema pulchrum TaxID=637853 RepID=A0A183EXI7_9BILA|nr:unnamed protein product [Gongylonema pulchrum]